MTLILETNGKGFMCWVAELPGAFVRGASRDEIHRKLGAEIHAYAKWLNIAVPDDAPHQEELIMTNAVVEDGDTNILLEMDKESYKKPPELDHDCHLMRLSAKKAQYTYQICRNRDTVVPSKQRKTFYGDVYATIETQYRHVVGVQQYYLESIGIQCQICGDLEATRETTINEIHSRYLAEANRLYRTADEDWTLRKVIRRIIWHDRIHERAMRRMNEELCT